MPTIESNATFQYVAIVLTKILNTNFLHEKSFTLKSQKQPPNLGVETTSSSFSFQLASQYQYTFENERRMQIIRLSDFENKRQQQIKAKLS